MIVVAGCSFNGDHVVLDSFQTADADYEFISSRNEQAPDASSIRVNAMFDDATTITVSCPTDDADEATFAAAIQIRDTFFVAGYGLIDGESIAMADAIRTLATEEIDGRRYFLVQLRNQPEPGPVPIPIAAADGTSRTIISVGLAD